MVEYFSMAMNMTVIIFKSHNHLILLQRDRGRYSLRYPFFSVGVRGGFARQYLAMLELNLQASRLNLPKTGITGVNYHIWQEESFKSEYNSEPSTLNWKDSSQF